VADVFAVLTADHDRILALSNQLTGGPAVPPDEPEERKAIAGELVEMLSRHEVIEEMLFWPAVREHADDGDQMSQVALEQEKTGKRMLNELVHTSPGNEEFDTLTQALAGLLREHISYEQNIVWPKLRLRLSEEEAHRLGEDLQRASHTAPTRPHPHVPPDPRLLRTAAPAMALLDKARNAVIRGTG
jgi:hemerythrin-like domain-containing protein